MKTKYTEINYPNDKGNTYPDRYFKHICENHFFNELKGRKILDIGCGKGLAMKQFAKYGLKPFGIDCRDEGVDNFKLCNMESDEIPYQDDTFDIIYSKSVIEHVVNSENFVNESMRVLKPGGLFICLTPDWESGYKCFWDDYTHVKPFTRKSLQNILLINNYVDVECSYFYQLPFLWHYPRLVFIAKSIAFLLPDGLKWKTKSQRNTEDRKLIRFSKERMLLAKGFKSA
jgi:2-polyprenyl-3-methyl-5-hydroxy-6-metoxy-1,4-benzoquinol methylase